MTSLYHVTLVTLASFSAFFFWTNPPKIVDSDASAAAASIEAKIASRTILGQIQSLFRGQTKDAVTPPEPKTKDAIFWNFVNGFLGRSNAVDDVREKKKQQQKNVEESHETNWHISWAYCTQSQNTDVIDPDRIEAEIAVVSANADDLAAAGAEFLSRLAASASDAASRLAVSASAAASRLAASASAALEFCGGVVENLAARLYENALLYFLLSIVTPVLAAALNYHEMNKRKGKRMTTAKARSFKLRMTDGIFHDYFQVERGKNAGVEFWAAEKGRKEKNSEEEEAGKGDAAEIGTEGSGIAENGAAENGVAESRTAESGTGENGTAEKDAPEIEDPIGNDVEYPWMGKDKAAPLLVFERLQSFSSPNPEYAFRQVNAKEEEEEEEEEEDEEEKEDKEEEEEKKEIDEGEEEEVVVVVAVEEEVPEESIDEMEVVDWKENEEVGKAERGVGEEEEKKEKEEEVKEEKEVEGSTEREEDVGKSAMYQRNGTETDGPSAMNQRTEKDVLSATSIQDQDSASSGIFAVSSSALEFDGADDDFKKIAKKELNKEPKVERNEELNEELQEELQEELSPDSNENEESKTNSKEAAKDVSAVGPMGDAVEAIFPEEVITLAVVTSANFRKGGVETLI